MSVLGFVLCMIGGANLYYGVRNKSWFNLFTAVCCIVVGYGFILR